MKVKILFQYLKHNRLIFVSIISLVVIASGIGVYAAVRPHHPALNPVTSTEPTTSIVSPTSVTDTSSATPVQPDKPSPTTNRTSSSYNYTPFVCTKTVLHYNTVYKDASYMDAGQTSSSGGQDGYTSTCTTDSNGYKPSDSTLPPYDKTVYTGTRQPQSQSTPQPSGSTYTPVNAQQYCNQYGNSSAYDLCVYGVNQENAKHQ